MVRIIHNVGGIPGLHVAVDAFSERVERRLFELERIHTSNIALASTSSKAKRTGAVVHPGSWPSEMFAICNVVKDSGLFPGYITPDYCLALNYPPGAGFQHHFDSRYRWGETVVGVSLGQPSTIYFTPGNAKTKKGGVPNDMNGDNSGLTVRVKNYPKSDSFAIDVELPRRSIYVMSGSARVDWKHGIRNQPKNIPQTPSWNPLAIRRSLTIRATKCFSDITLEDLAQQNPNDASLQRRLKDQQKYKPANGDGTKLNAQELEQERRNARELLNMMQNFLPIQSRFSQEDLTFTLPPEAVAANAALNNSSMGSMMGMARGGMSMMGMGGGMVMSGGMGGQIAPDAPRFPGSGQAMSPPGKKKRKSEDNDGEVMEISAAEMRSRRLARFSPDKKMKSEEGSGCSSGKKAVGGGGGGTIDLTNSDDEEDNGHGNGQSNGSHATNSDEEDEQLRKAIALSMK